MNGKTFATLVAGAMLALGTGQAAAENNDDAKGCYRKTCGTSVKGHKGSCGGTRVDAIADEKTCTEAGGAWVTAAEAEKYKM